MDGYLSALVFVPKETFFIKVLKRVNSKVIAHLLLETHPRFYETK